MSRRLLILAAALSAAVAILHVAISSIYVLRGLIAFPQMRALLASGRPLLDRNLAFSLVSLIIGLVFLSGTVLAWRD